MTCHQCWLVLFPGEFNNRWQDIDPTDHGFGTGIWADPVLPGNNQGYMDPSLIKVPLSIWPLATVIATEQEDNVLA